jgi:hypothetical protein
LAGKKKFRSYLDRLRENVEVLDESIASARKPAKGEKPADKRARLKLVRDLVELRGNALLSIKAHMNGHTESGAVMDPPDVWDDNSQVEFERYFQGLMEPWSRKDLRLECEDCGIESEDVSHHDFEEIHDGHYRTIVEAEGADLCPKCVEKREVARQRESSEPASKREIEAVTQSARLAVKALKTLPPDQQIAELEKMLADQPQIAPGMRPAYEAYRAVLQNELDSARRLQPIERH